MEAGQRVGIGFGTAATTAYVFIAGAEISKLQEFKNSGISYDGGYQQYMVAPVTALATIPEVSIPSKAAPLLCAGITTYNSLRHAGALPEILSRCRGSAVLSPRHSVRAQVRLQSRGHRTRSRNASLAEKLGAHVYIDSNATNGSPGVAENGRAQVILATAPSSKAMSALIDGLAPTELMVVGASLDPIEVTPRYSSFSASARFKAGRQEHQRIRGYPADSPN